MKFLCLLALSLAPAFAANWANGYTYRRTVTIDHTKVPNTDLSNFPILVNGTYSYLKTTANGGNVTNANGYDIIFTSDSSGTSTLAWQTVSYTASTGAVEYYVKVPTVSHTADTVIYLFYGKSAVTTDQSSATSVWDTNFKAVYHLADNGATTTVVDSTSTGANATNRTGVDLRTVAGKIGLGLSYNGSTDYTTKDGTSYGNGTAFTFSVWVKNTGTGNTKLYTEGSSVGFQFAFIGLNESTIGDAAFGVGDGSGTFTVLTSGDLSLTDGQWHLITGTQTSKSSRALYVDGVSRATNTTTIGALTLDWTTIGANRINGGEFNFLGGSLDEFRISNSARSADWISADYATQNSPATFYTLGAELTSPTTVKHHSIQQ